MATQAYPGLAIPGDTWPSFVGSGYSFSPPTVERIIAPDNRVAYRPFHKVRYHVGTTVLKDSFGNYRTADNPTEEDILNAATAYLGGRTYRISEAEAAALTAAGYEVTSA